MLATQFTQNLAKCNTIELLRRYAAMTFMMQTDYPMVTMRHLMNPFTRQALLAHSNDIHGARQNYYS